MVVFGRPTPPYIGVLQALTNFGEGIEIDKENNMTRYITRSIQFSVSNTYMSDLIRELEKEDGDLVCVIPVALIPAEAEKRSDPAYANFLPEGSFVVRDLLAIYKKP